ncbi:nucleotidyl transferase AbiEii/AbiGii toxin family protein [Butyrivibrio sp. AE2032]|uniref:nucleotidyl transferase AbiEii/AbiGii toxin family protein n=1 Tax=Butyrivibrio sp. AE2032 TaxID=1458463 RepID=UPI000553D899|nr:nucleotidyl transferase AbiEii/AbiGii toxin family protein [Butyrivibrio sp. AE2032]
MNDMSLKAKIRNIACDKRVSASAVLQNYLIRRFLFRLAKSDYKDKFIIKGGMLISSIIGIEQRSTMDLDATLRFMKLEESNLCDAFLAICSIPDEDGIQFKFNSISPIREDDEYGGYRISYSAIMGKINAPMSMDISTGDVITPDAKIHCFSDMFDPNQTIQLLSYPIETILAEKLETVLSRGVENTRPRDFYDIYMLSATDYNKTDLCLAFKATAKHRGSYDKIKDYYSVLENIRNDAVMNQRWNGYQKQMPYADGISFGETLDVVQQLLSDINQ